MHRASLPPPRFSLFSKMNLTARDTTEMTCTARKLKELVDARGDGSIDGIFDEAPSPIDLSFFPPSRPSLPIDLHPQVPIFQVGPAYNFASGVIEAFCRSHPICIIRGLTDRLNLDLGLFTFDRLAVQYPEMQVKVHIQPMQHPDTNLDEGGSATWEMISEETSATLKGHTDYMKKQEDSRASKKKKEDKVRFGIANLSKHPDRFDQQLKELEKLPRIFRPSQPDDILTLMDYDIDGLHGVFSFLKVRGVRTHAHEEDGGIPSINIEIGPGCSEWFGCELQYVEKVQELAANQGLEYGNGTSLWPSHQELEAAGVPVYRFSQKPGDLVFTGPGTLHWVQGEEMGSNIAWNCGPLSFQVLKHAKWQYERDRTQRRRSTIPLEATIWKIAERRGVEQENMYFVVRGMLCRSLSHLMMQERWLEDRGINVEEMDEDEKTDGISCDGCNVELFNLVYVNTANEDHCYHCAEAKGGAQSHSVRRQRSMETLCSIFDKFVFVVDLE